MRDEMHGVRRGGLVMDGEYLTCRGCGTKYTLETARRMLQAGGGEPSPESRGRDDASAFTIVAGTLKNYQGQSRDVVIPHGVFAIGGSAFSGTPIASVDIPDSVTSIGASAFYGCTSLESVDIPRSVTSIGVGAFRGCTSLASVRAQGNPRGLESAFPCTPWALGEKYRARGVCQHCGGAFKGVFKMVCADCGRPKDY